jgi:hypothetical protein
MVTFEEWWEDKELQMHQMQYSDYDQTEAAWDAAKEDEREKWADWIGNVLTEKHPEYQAMLWAIAECMEQNHFGKVAKVQGK